MNAIVLPAGTTHVRLEELEELIADALFPYTGPDDARLRAGYALANIGDELDMEARAGKLLLRDGLTLGPYQVRMGEKIVNALVAVDDLRDYVGLHRKLTVIVEAPESAAPPVVAETPAVPVVAEIDYGMLATPEKLIEAFGQFTGMDRFWFNKLADKPELLAARAVEGKKGKGGYAPLFYPITVMFWLIDQKRKTGKPISEATAWRMLKAHFPRVHAAHSDYDPNNA